MATYWHKHSRGFANECSLLRAATPEEAHYLARDGYTRLTRTQAHAHVRWLNAENASWGSGRAVGDDDFAALIDPNHRDYLAHQAATLIAERAAFDREARQIERELAAW